MSGGFKDAYEKAEKEKRAADIHEAGHEDIAVWIKPDIRYDIVKDGKGNGVIEFHPVDFAALTLEQRYQIGVAGCLAEAKGMTTPGDIQVEELENLRTQIFNGVRDQEEKWQVDVPIHSVTHPEPASCNRYDFRFLGTSAPSAKMILDALKVVAAKLNEPEFWKQVQKKAKF